jgi:hypothetical protein
MTIDATGGEDVCTVHVIEHSTAQEEVLWVGTDDGKVHVSRNNGQSWSDVSGNLPEFPEGAWIQQIKASNKNAGEALLIANDYRRFNYTPYAYRTRDYGESWDRIVDANDVIGYTLSIVEDPEEKNLLFLGTDDGLYVSIDAGANWTKWDAENFPSTNVYDLVIHPREHDLVAGTFGRSIWVLDDIRPLRALAREGISSLNRPLQLYEPPTAYLAERQQPAGSRFGGNALYNGENRRSGAMITYSITRPEAQEGNVDSKADKRKKDKNDIQKTKEDTSGDEEQAVSYDSLITEIFKGDERIRTLKTKASEENGMHRMYWYMREKGVPSMRRGNVNRDREPSGTEVLPGTYKVRLQFGDQRDSTMITVESDPRINLSMSDRIAKYEAIKSLEARGALGFEAVELLKENISLVEDIQKELKEKDEDAFEEAISKSKEVADTLNRQLDLFLGAEDDRQGITRGGPVTIRSRYSTAYNYLSNALHAPGKTENQLIEQFENALNEALDVVNEYFREEWPEYRKLIEGLDRSPFKDVEEIK